MRNDLERFLVFWCRTMHDSITWPRDGCYRCRSCGRVFPVPWAAQERVHVARASPLPVCAALDPAHTA
jgi:hypothetical protein